MSDYCIAFIFKGKKSKTKKEKTDSNQSRDENKGYNAPQTNQHNFAF